MAGVVVAVAVLLLAAGAAAWAVLMVRLAKTQQRRPSRKRFDGRYTDFGFLLGIFDRPAREEPRRRAGAPNSGREERAGSAEQSRR